MTSVLHQFLQSLSAVIFLGFIIQLSFISQSNLYLNFIGYLHSIFPLPQIFLINKIISILIIILLTFLIVIKSLVIKPSYLQNLSTLVYFALGLSLMGFSKLTLGEFNAFTVGFLKTNKTIFGKELMSDENLIKINDYSTMYASPNGYFYFFIMLVNLIGMRAFSKVKKAGDPIDTKLPSRAEFRESQVVSKKRRNSIDENDLVQTRRKSIELNQSGDHPLAFGSMRNDVLESNRKFELFEKEFSVQSAENLSQADSNTTNVKSSSSMVFLEKFELLKKPASIISILLRLKDNDLCIQKKDPQLVIFWLMTYRNFKRLSSILLFYIASSLYLSGNAFTTDLLFAFLLGKIYSRFFFRVLER